MEGHAPKPRKHSLSPRFQTCNLCCWMVSPRCPFPLCSFCPWESPSLRHHRCRHGADGTSARTAGDGEVAPKIAQMRLAKFIISQFMVDIPISSYFYFVEPGIPKRWVTWYVTWDPLPGDGQGLYHLEDLGSFTSSLHANCSHLNLAHDTSGIVWAKYCVSYCSFLFLKLFKVEVDRSLENSPLSRAGDFVGFRQNFRWEAKPSWSHSGPPGVFFWHVPSSVSTSPRNGGFNRKTIYKLGNCAFPRLTTAQCKALWPQSPILTIRTTSMAPKNGCEQICSSNGISTGNTSPTRSIGSRTYQVTLILPDIR